MPCVVTEALGRGHHVTAFSRDATRIDEDRKNVVWQRVDVLDANGRSRISVEGAAVALVDEAELPCFVRRRFTIGY
ncbi:hypothetical protein [Streptomyces virginiae]|uniref:hypothetical protein n=1 Tax=Streptomyces virginiae TaxID=1961 RepID=UPI00365CD045